MLNLGTENLMKYHHPAPHPPQGFLDNEAVYLPLILGKFHSNFSAHIVYTLLYD